MIRGAQGAISKVCAEGESLEMVDGFCAAYFVQAFAEGGLSDVARDPVRPAQKGAREGRERAIDSCLMLEDYWGYSY